MIHATQNEYAKIFLTAKFRFAAALLSGISPRMSQMEYQRRDAEQMRERIIDAAVHLFEKGGSSIVSMRKIAERIDYSPAALYLYFKGKKDILLALSDRGFSLLYQRMLPVASTPDPKERLLELCRVYLAFAAEEPEYYRLIFSDPEVHYPNPTEDSASKPAYLTYSLLQDATQECMERGLLTAGDPLAATVGMWSAMHGVASLLSGGRMHVVPQERLDSLADDVLRFILR